MKEKGQVILLLILIMTVALSIGLSIVQKSLVDVSTASKVEQSSRAFSAAEAGIEKGLGGDTSLQTFTDTSSKITEITNTGLMPAVPAVGTRQAALEFPSLAKEDVAQVWLSDPTSNLPNCDSGKVCYTQNTLDVYWGNSSTDRAAIEITLVHHDGTQYVGSRKWYLDQINRSNGFCQIPITDCSGGNPAGANTYQCKVRLGDSNVTCANGVSIDNSALPTTSPNKLMLLRMRLLYNSTSQPFAVRAVGTCDSSCYLPAQARSIESTGVSGETQRKVQVFQLEKVVPHYFDYSIFSAGEISK